MSKRERFGREYIETELKRLSEETETEVKAYLIGGGALSIRKLKDTTKDIDLVVTNDESYQKVLGMLNGIGYNEITDLGEEYKRLGARHCVQNEDDCQIDLFNRQIANKLFFSDGMKERSELFLSEGKLQVFLTGLEDIFLFKAVAERDDDIEDMATLVQTDLDFGVIEDEIESQVELIGGERFTTIIAESLSKLDAQYGIQTPLGEVVDEYYERYMNGFELRQKLNENSPKTVAKLAEELNEDETEIINRFEYLRSFGVAEKTPDGILLTGEEDRFIQSN
jgi:hypothetical protein